MKLIRLTTVYPSYLAKFYAFCPGLDARPYEEQYQQMVHDAFGWADFWTHALSRFGYEVWEPIANAEPMQRMWAEENGCSSATSGWTYDITLAQAHVFKPDVVFIDDYGAFDAGFIYRLRAAVPSIRLILGWCAAPYADERIFSHYDVTLTSIPGLANFFRGKGLRSEVVMHAFDPRVLGRLDLQRPKRLGFTFVGSVRPGAPHLEQRQQLLRELCRRGGLEVYADIYFPPVSQPARNGLVRLRRRILELATRGSPDAQSAEQCSEWRKLATKVHAAEFGLEMFQTLRDSAVSFNSHSGFHGEWASNMRLYEATGVGTCLLTDYKHNLTEIFRPDEEVVIYRSLPECLEKIRWLLDHRAEREAIAQAGQLRTLRDHTFEQRAEVLDAVIKRSLKRTSS